MGEARRKKLLGIIPKKTKRGRFVYLMEKISNYSNFQIERFADIRNLPKEK